MFEFTTELSIVILSTCICLLTIEIYYQNYKKQKFKNYDWLFNWTFPNDKPFTLLALPLLILFVINYFLIPNLNVLAIAMTFSIAVQVLVEEITFRGIVFGALLKKFYENKKNSLWMLLLLFFIQALLFAIVHYQTKNFIGVFSSGLIFGIVFYFSGKNVLAPTILHLALNLLIFQNYLTIKMT
ncbi:MAG: CPBP family intramembrane glutamic endopeptidase [Candidatus Diapherotrites archaeon]